MTIDEAYNTCFGKPYIVQIDKHEEAMNIIRDLIEEVKQYRKIGTVEECKESVLDSQKAYNKAIDYFVNACKEDILCQTFGLHINGIERIAEQLKAGDVE